MEKPDLKLLKSLADACRKSGITSFEGYGFKFTVDAQQATSAKRSRSRPTTNQVSTDESMIEWDDLSDEEKLYYSVGGTPGPVPVSE